MAYRGENIDIFIKGDEQYNLDANDFNVFVYPDRHPETKHVILKSDMVRRGDNHYAGGIMYNASKNLPVGLYTIEVLLIEGTSHRSVFVKQGAFPLYDSASKSIE